MLILYKIIVFTLFKSSIFEEFHRFYIFFINQLSIITYVSQSKYCFHQNHQKNYTHYHKYNHSNQASYQDSMYVVKPGDTLFYIAWITGNHYLDLAKNNNIKNIHILQVNQVLQVQNNTMKPSFLKTILKTILLPFHNSHCKIKKRLIFNETKKIPSKIKKHMFFNIHKIKKVSYENKTNVIISANWNWPAYGSIINTFSDTEGGNTGIDISGALDQPILATTNGQVVYVGNVLKGYGNLVIIKHDNNYLSAYAHNNKILVTEQQHVKIGDQIATMGSSGTDQIKLHFEIRYKGKSINPLHLLP